LYQLCLLREFTARHYLVGGDWGSENREHAHRYKLEWELGAVVLDDDGFLIDLTVLEKALVHIVEGITDQVLNDLPAFRERNPSLERFAHYLSDQLVGFLDQADPTARIQHSIIRLWESHSAWAAWTQSRA